MDRDLVRWLGMNDPVSCVTHALGALGLLLAWRWIQLRVRDVPERRRRVGIQLYAACGALQWTCSALYHLFPNGTAPRLFFWRLDHATIWISLAGGFTAVMSAFGAWRWRYLQVVWAVAIFGAGLELTSLPQIAPWIPPLLYVGMGWLGFPSWLEAARRHGALGRPLWLMVGGLLATFGGLIDSLEQPNPWPRLFEAHELMHVLIWVGGWLYAYSIVLGARAISEDSAAWQGQLEPDAPLIPVRAR